MKNIISLPPRRSRFVVAYSLTVWLTACGGGGSPATPPAPPPSGSGGGGFASSTYLFYSGSLNAVDPASPASPIVVDPGSDIVTDLFGTSPVIATFQSGTYNSTTQTITNIHPHALIYAKTNGKFYRVSVLKSGSLIPVQVSSENGADTLCVNAMQGTANFMDFANVDNSQYVYALPGADGDCETGDDVWKMVHLGMSATDAPVAAKPPVRVLGDVTTGAISGWLINDAGALKRCDASFTGCTSLRPVTNKVDARLDLGSNRHLLEIDNQLFVYDSTTNALSASIFTLPPATMISVPATDNSHIYFWHAKQLYRAPADGSAMAIVIASETDDIAHQMVVTANKVVYATLPQISSGVLTKAAQLKVVDKTGGTTTLLATHAAADAAFFAVNGRNIYYSFIDTLVSATGSIRFAALAAGMIDENGGGKSETANANWSGWIYPTAVDLSKGSNLAYYAPQKMIRAEGYDALGSGKGFAGGTLKSFDATTGAAGATLGTLPGVDNMISLTCFGDTDNTLCQAMFEITPAPALPALPFQTDVFFINAATAGSLTRVTNTAGKNEAPVY